MPVSVSGSDGYAAYKRSVQTPTENAVDTFLRLHRLRQQVEEKERELAVYMRDPKFNLNAYLEGISNA